MLKWNLFRLWGREGGLKILLTSPKERCEPVMQFGLMREDLMIFYNGLLSAADLSGCF